MHLYSIHFKSSTCQNELVKKYNPAYEKKILKTSIQCPNVELWAFSNFNIVPGIYIVYFDHTPPLSRPPFERKTPPRKFNEFKPNRCNFTDFHAFFLSNFLFPSLIYPVFIFFPQRPSPPPPPPHSTFLKFNPPYHSHYYNI